MTEMVHSPLHLDSFFCGFSLGDGHDASVVDEVVNFGEFDCIGESLDGGSAGEVEGEVLYLCPGVIFPDGFYDRFCCLLVPGADDDRAS